jgi:hypothetical protein
MLKELVIFFSYLKNGDPLIINDNIEYNDKDENLKIGIKAIEGNFFMPSLFSAPHLFHGHS